MIGTNELLQLLAGHPDVLVNRAPSGVIFAVSSPAELAAMMFRLALEAGAAGADVPELLDSLDAMTTRDGDAFDLVVEIPTTNHATR